jgi:hypothetical protein
MFSGSEDVKADALFMRGWAISAIARHLGRDRKTVRYDLIVQANKPGGASVTANFAGRNATCSADNPITRSGKVAGNSRTCPA